MLTKVAFKTLDEGIGLVGQVALRLGTDRAAVILRRGSFSVCEGFRRLTLRSATGLSQRDKPHPRSAQPMKP
jgi:hypothetical protein